LAYRKSLLPCRERESALTDLVLLRVGDGLDWLPRDGVGALQPTAEIEIGATLAAEGAIVG
jgi:hypothetical protein